jgi:hypothetical protein
MQLGEIFKTHKESLTHLLFLTFKKPEETLNFRDLIVCDAALSDLDVETNVFSDAIKVKLTESVEKKQKNVNESEMQFELRAIVQLINSGDEWDRLT